MDEDISRVPHHQSSKRKKCKICKNRYDKRGFKKHYAACEQNKAADERWEALQAEYNDEESEGEREGRKRSRKRRRRGTISSAVPLPQAHEATTSLDEEHRSPAPLLVPAPSSPPVPSSIPPEEEHPSGNPPSTPHPPPLPPPPLTQPNASSSSAPPTTIDEQPTPNLDDIRVEYHPKSVHKTTVYPFEQYCQQRPKTDFAANLDEPWRPFETRCDFEFAELVHEAHMSHDAIERLLKLVRDVQTGEADLTFNSHSDLRRAWDNASHFYPTFSQSVVSAEYKKEIIQYDFHHRSLWDWLVSQVEDPKLAPYFHWDAQRIYKYNGERWVRIWEEPCAADMFWEAQTHIAGMDAEGKPLGLIVWADKNKMSAFGTQKAHPIVVRISNLDSAVRNGTGPGGGRIVGLVPMIEETAAEKGKKNYIDWKHAIYHDAFRILLEQVAANSRTGYRLTCGDNKPRTIYPFVHIITADYEEQCFFALTRGLHGLAPCPVCLVPEGELSNLAATYAEREEDHARKLVEKAEGKTLKEAKVKHFGLRAVKNAMWDVMRTNIYKALSFDRLHAYLLGIFLHVFRILKLIIAKLSRKAQATVDKNLESVPSWPGLTRFNSLTNTDFSDGGKWADMSKIIIPCSYSIFSATSLGYKLLMVMRKYIECDTYSSLSVQTDDTLADYDSTIQQFGIRLAEYSERCADGDEDVKFDKDWDGIIKVHSHLHATRDIRLKGSMANMDTKSSEKLHGPLRKAYQMQTNFKNIEGQLGRLEDYSMVACDIRNNIAARDEYMNSQKAAEKLLKKQKDRITQFNHVYLGAPFNNSVSILALTTTHQLDPAFRGFQTKLTTCIRDLVSRVDEADRLATSERIATRDVHVEVTDQVLEYCLLRIPYESRVTWREESDLLRCSSLFHGRPRYDCVIIEHASRLMFCQLICVFTYKFRDATCGLALVLPFDLTPNLPSANRRIDRDLGLCRVKERSRADSIIVPVRAIKRGALVVSDSSRVHERLVVDTLDGDMFLRCIDLFPNRDMAAQIRLQL